MAKLTYQYDMLKIAIVMALISIALGDDNSRLIIIPLYVKKTSQQ